MKKVFTYLLLFFTNFLTFSQNTPVIVGGVDSYDVSHKVKTMTKDEEIAQMQILIDKTTTCAAAAAAAVQLQDCADVGTGSFLTTATNVNFTNTGGATVPGVAETCTGAAGYTTAGTWVRMNPDPGVSTLTFQFQSGSSGAGNHNAYIQMFQGSCAALTPLYCDDLLQFSMGSSILQQVYTTGVNPAQDVWAYVWDDSGSGFDLNFEVIGSGTPPANTTCAGAATNASGGCNLGAAPGTFTTPGAAGVACSGGNWGSNENTLFFSITASATTGSIDLNNVICNDGTAGNAQFGVFNSCACVGTYTAGCFRQCAVGAGVVNLASLTPGSTYILAIDGFAGDVCVWDFVTTGIIMPVELSKFNAEATPLGNRISWEVLSERSCDYYSLKRTNDLSNGYQEIAKIDGSGNSSSKIDYEYLDDEAPFGTNYYILTQVDFDGKETDYSPKIVHNDYDRILVSPNPVSDEMNVKFSSKFITNSTIQVVDATGKIVQNFSFETSKGLNNLNMNSTDLGTGLYTLIISNGYENKHVKFVK